MKELFKFMLMATIATSISIAFVSCGNDDDDHNNGGGTNTTTSANVNPQNVFTGGMPKSFAGNQIMTNADGLVYAITGEEGVNVSFKYSKATKADMAYAYDVMMTIYGEGEIMICNMTLGKNGFVSHCDEMEIYEGGRETETWDFTYNSNGQLAQMQRSEGGKEKTQIKYENGNIVEVSTTSEEEPGETSTYKIYYTSDDTMTAIENKGCIMLFDNTLGIDMDEMEYAYLAGLLGKATKHLPVRCVDVTENYTDIFTWTLNNAGYPIKLSFDDSPETISFVW